MPTVEDFIRFALAQLARVNAELVQYAAEHVGITLPPCRELLAHCRAAETMLEVDVAIGVRGALLFVEEHVAISLGNGCTIEPNLGDGHRVIRGVAQDRFASGAYLPELQYPEPEPDETDSGSSVRG